MSALGASSKCKNWLILFTALPLAIFAFVRAYCYDQDNTALVFAEVAAAYVVIQTAIESASFTNELLKDCITYALKVISAVIAVFAVYAV
ncbi:MAG: hypothetical protein ACRC1U_02920 [Vibrionaceae bacterium]